MASRPGQPSLPGRALRAAILALATHWLATPAGAIVAGQIDDFENTTTMGWRHGSNFSPSAPTNAPNGGPNGSGDAYVSVTSTGGGGAGSRLVMLNTAQWTGNYTVAGVKAIRADVANFGTAPLHIRIGLADPSRSLHQFVSTNAHVVPATGIWRRVVFNLTATDLTRVAGTFSLAQLLASVGEVRILSQSSGPGWIGDGIEGALGADNIQALTEVVGVEPFTWSRVKSLFATE